MTVSSIKAVLRDAAIFSDLCLIGGIWTGTPSQSVTDPATGDELASVPHLGAVEASEAVTAAKEAFAGWSQMLAKERAGLMRRWFELIGHHREDLATILTREQGKPLAEALGEIDYAASFVEFYAEEARRVYGETIPAHRRDARIIVTKQPVGVVAAITPWNFPAAMITRKIAPALAAGCTTVVKPAPETPLTALALAKLAERAGFPVGVVNVITGDAAAIGKVLTEHPDVRAISFTGSTTVGKLLMRQAASTVKKIGLELGGNAPFIVFDDADVEAAAEGAIMSKFRNMGQTCVCANRIYVQDGVYDVFVERLVAKVSQLKVGNGMDAGTEQGPLINSAAADKVRRHITDARDKGARIVVGGEPHALGGTFFQPTVLADVPDDAAITTEETFGPVAPIYRFSSDDEVIAKANATPFGLAAYFYSRDLRRVFHIAERLEAGMVGINSALLSTDVAPFGGVKESGLGREGSRHGLEEYLETKYMLVGGLT